MDVWEAILTRRSIRRFQNREVPEVLLEKLAEAARFYPCAANLQPLRFFLTADPALCGGLFECVHWAGYLPGYRMEKEQQPKAYLVIFGDRTVSERFEFAAGAAAAELLLAIHAEGLAGCCLGLSQKERAAELCGTDPKRYEPLYLLAMGYPLQEARVTEDSGTCRYTMDENGNMIVPKRARKDILLEPVQKEL